jgi:signal transduction histidine kinase
MPNGRGCGTDMINLNEGTTDPSILDGIEQLIYIADIETHELLFVNRKGRELLGCGDKYYGKKCYELLQGLDDVCPFCRNKCLSLNTGTFKWDHYNDKLGINFQFQDSCITFNGHHARIEIGIDVSESETRQSELRHALDEQKMLADCTRTLNGNGDNAEKMEHVLSDIGRYYGADRAYVYSLCRDYEGLKCKCEWRNGDIAAHVFTIQGIGTHYTDRWTTAFENGSTLIVADTEQIRDSYPDEYKVMSKQDIRSYIEVSLFESGKVSGFLGIDNPDPAVISNFSNSSDTMMTLAYAISNTLERESAEEKLINAQRRYKTTVEGADIGIWEYHIKEHRISNASRKFEGIGFPPVVENVPDCLLPYFQADSRKKLKDLYAALDRGEEHPEGDFWLRWAPDTQYRCEHISYFLVKDSAGNPDVAYGISIDITAQKREQWHYQQAVASMNEVIPNAVGTIRCNLSKDLFISEYEEQKFFGISGHSGSWDHIILNISSRIPDKKERDAYLAFRTDEALDLFKKGTNSIQREYSYSDPDEKMHWISTRLQMIRNPDTDDIEGAAYSLDLSREKIQNQIFRIITSRSFDLVALIHLDTGIFEAVFLGDSYPEDYRRFLPGHGAVCDFRDYCAEALKHMRPESAANYKSRLSPEYMRKSLESSNGSYEFTIREEFPNSRHGFVYRKFLHYALDSDHDTVLVIESDVTDAVLRQEKEIQMAKDEAAHDCMIMDSILGGISVLQMTDKQHLKVQYFNSYVFQMLGYDPAGMPQRIDEAMGTPSEALFSDALTFVHDDDKQYVKNTFLENYDSETFSLKPYRMYGKDGKCYWMLERVRTGTSADGSRVFYAAINDVTEEITLQKTVTKQLEVEMQLRKKADQANSAKTDFLSRMSHDMRTPLNGILGMAYLAREQTNPPYTSDCLSKINTSAKFLLGLINNILDMAKVESGKIELNYEPYSIDEFNDYLDAVIRPLCEERDQHFVLNEDVDLQCIPLTDKGRTNQILFNLLSNAVKFTPEGGTITYDIRCRQTSKGRASIEHKISDTGIGISPEFQRRLFEPFTQEGRDDNSELRGSGLGLSIVKRLVDLMGGTISVKSRIGFGTTFIVRFEFDTLQADSSDASFHSSANSHDNDSDLSGMHILICEDHPLNQEIARALLEEKGAIVRIAENGQKGVDFFSHSSVGYFDCILMDLRMPVMDGLKAAKAVRASARPDASTVPIFAMTADAFSDDIQKCHDAGMNGHISKPIDPEILYKSMHDILNAAKEK